MLAPAGRPRRGRRTFIGSTENNSGPNFFQDVNLVPSAWDLERSLQFGRITRKKFVEHLFGESRWMIAFNHSRQPHCELGNNRNMAAGRMIGKELEERVE